MPISIHFGSQCTDEHEAFALDVAERLSKLLPPQKHVALVAGFAARGRRISLAIFGGRFVWVVVPPAGSVEPGNLRLTPVASGLTGQPSQSSSLLHEIGIARLALYEAIAELRASGTNGLPEFGKQTIVCRIVTGSERTARHRLGTASTWCRFGTAEQILREIANRLSRDDSGANYDFSPGLLRVLDLSTERLTAPETGCFLCASSETPCDFWELRGKVEHVRSFESGDWQLRIRTVLRTPANLILRSPWSELGEALKFAVERGIKPEIVVHHLRESSWNGWPRWIAGKDSLVTVQPGRKLDVSSVSTIAGCHMAYLAGHTGLDRPSEARVRGTVLHRAFELLQGEVPMQQALAAATVENAVELALAGVDEEKELQALESYRKNLEELHSRLRMVPVRLESTVVDDSLGISGRIDVLLGAPGKYTGLLELKSGAPGQGNFVRLEHRRQAQLYAAALWHLGVMPLDGARIEVAYLGGETLQVLPVDFDWYAIRRALLARNSAALLDLSGFSSQNVMCDRCPKFRKASCDWLGDAYGYGRQRSLLRPEDREHFQAWIRALLEEQAATSEENPAFGQYSEFTEAGRPVALPIAEIQQLESTSGWLALLVGANHTRFRPGEIVELVESGPLPRTVNADILKVSDAGMVVSCDSPAPWASVARPLRAASLLRRQFQALDGWLKAEERLRRLVEGSISPRFSGTTSSIFGLNESQIEAANLTASAEDYVLVWGPPGTGKTRTLAAIAAEAAVRGQRILLSAMTNQAVENLLSAVLEIWSGEPLLLARKPRNPSLAGASLHAGSPSSSEAARRLRDAQIVAATAHSLSSGKYDFALRGGGEFDLTILDEATQLTEPLALGAVRLGKRFVLVGDHRQLSPIVQSGNQQLSVSLFERMWALPSAQEARVMLRTQYRMHPEIAEFPSNAWYGGELRSDESTHGLALDSARVIAGLPIWEPGLVSCFVDFDVTDAGRHHRQELLQFAADIVGQARFSGILATDIGVIAAYRSQVASIYRLLDQTDFAAGVTVDTADRFQGAERDLMIVLLQPEGRDRLLWDERRLNVSFTRARKKLVVIGNSKILEQIPVVETYIQYHRHRGTLLRFDELTAKRQPAAVLPK